LTRNSRECLFEVFFGFGQLHAKGYVVLVKLNRELFPLTGLGSGKTGHIKCLNGTLSALMVSNSTGVSELVENRVFSVLTGCQVGKEVTEPSPLLLLGSPLSD